MSTKRTPEYNRRIRIPRRGSSRRGDGVVADCGIIGLGNTLRTGKVGPGCRNLCLEAWQTPGCTICSAQGLQNAMTSSRERMSAEAGGYRIERSPMDCVAPPLTRGGATQSISVLEQMIGC